MLNTNKFNSIVRLFNLESPIDYFILYNNTRFMNGYHGYEHMKRTVCSVFELSKNHKLRYVDLESLFYAAIFHDFGYLGTNKSDPNYDSKNIELAIKFFDNYYNNFSNMECSQSSYIKDLIRGTQFPNCLESDEIDTIQSILIDADLSMVLYEGGASLHQLLYYVLDYNGEPDYQLFRDNVISWSKACRFRDPVFSEMWEKEKESIVEETFRYVKYHSDIMGIANNISENDNVTPKGFRILCDMIRNSSDYLKDLLTRYSFEYF